MDNVVSISSGCKHYATITTDGNLYTWGDNSYGQLGNEKNIDNVIVDEADAYDVLLSVQSDLGIYNAEDEYSYSYMRSNNYYDVYTMQQYYNGIEVYGSELKLTADKSGNLLSVNGVHKQLDGFDTSVSLSESDAYNQVEKYLKSEYQVTTDDVSINEMGKKIFFDENDESVVGYLFEIVDNLLNTGVFYIAINGNTGEVITKINLFSNSMKEKTFKGQSSNQTLDVDEEDGEYRLVDIDRRIVVYNGYGSLDIDDVEKRIEHASNADNIYMFKKNPDK